MNELSRTMISYSSQILELVGVFIIMIGALQAVYGLILSKFNLENTKIKINLAKSLELALEFKLAAEILKTVLIHTKEELLILSSVVVLRVIMTLVIHWELKKGEPEK